MFRYSGDGGGALTLVGWDDAGDAVASVFPGHDGSGVAGEDIPDSYAAVIATGDQERVGLARESDAGNSRTVAVRTVGSESSDRAARRDVPEEGRRAVATAGGEGGVSEGTAEREDGIAMGRIGLDWRRGDGGRCMMVGLLCR